jgi:hypothetical protein
LQKLGIGAQDQREMIRRLIPDGTTVTKQHANEQLNLFESTLNSVERGLIKANLNAPSLITNNQGITPASALNKQWQVAIDEMEQKGFAYNPQTREWEQGATRQSFQPGMTPSAPGAAPTAPDLKNLSTEELLKRL